MTFFIKRLFSTKKLLPITQLESLYNLSTSVNNVSSTIEKRDILKENTECHSILKRIYDPHLRHHVTSKSVLKYLDTHTPKESLYQDLGDLLNDLSSRNITGHSANEAIIDFYATYCKTEPLQEMFWRVLDRNLKMGASTKTIRRLFEDEDDNQISTSKNHRFNVTLASKFMKDKIVNYKDEEWYISQKLDGIRCITIVRPDKKKVDIQFYSRTGRPFTSLRKVKIDIETQLKKTASQLIVKDETKDEKKDEKKANEFEKINGFVLDGEVCAYDNDNSKNENFTRAQKEIRRINFEMENPVYHIFDFIPLDQFLAGKGSKTFLERQESLKKFFNSSESPSHLRLVRQTRIVHPTHLEQYKANTVEAGWEGLVLRKNTPYEGKRSRYMLKIKEWEDAEYVVKKAHKGPMRMPDTGENKMVLVRVDIEHKGNIVSVGSGFSIRDRIRYGEDPSLIVGKTITVRYFQESQKGGGLFSLRFPTVKAIYEDGVRDI